jgi:hypothetical protein
MSDTILGGDFTVYYGAENRQKRIEWTGATTGTRTVNELYSALQNLFDELTQMDDGVPMSAQTPTEYTIGIIDTGDKDPWFIDRTSVEHLTGGALKTASWDRVQDSNIGIVKIEYTEGGTALQASDIGETITNGTATGTILDYNTEITPKILWIRPTDSSSTHNWSASSGEMTVSNSSANPSQSAAAASAGESLWANIYSLGTIEKYTHVYVYQNGSYLTAYKGTTDWWTDQTTSLTATTDHIDILVNVSELGSEIDEGFVTVLARQYTKTYSYYIVDLHLGGRNPIPLQTGVDLDNQTGVKRLTLTASAANFDAGNFIYWTDDGVSDYTWATTTKRGVITAVDTTNDYIYYYLLGDPITDFSANDTVIQEWTGTTNGDGTGTVDGSAPVDAGPADLTTLPTARHGITATQLSGNDGGSFDVNEDGNPENYSIVIDCNQNALADVYEWTKWITRRGETNQDAETDGLNSEYYIGTDYRMTYSSDDGTLTEGSTVTGSTSGATGTVVYHNDTDNIVILRNSRRGTANFSSGEDLTQGGVTITSITPTAITPIAAAPFGTFAGGKFFCAPGVVLTDYLVTELNNFQLVDDGGTVRVAPTKVNINVGNTQVGDRVAVFRLDGEDGEIQKDRYSATVQSAGATTVVIDTGGGITYDEPGKTSGGVLRIVDISGFTEYRLRYASWDSSTFTLDNIEVTATAGTDTTTIFSTGNLGSVVVGDLVYNNGNGHDGVSYVTDISGAPNSVTISPAITGQTSGDTIDFNAIPINTATDDTIYVPYMDIYVTTAGTQTAQVVYQTGQATIYTRVRARRSIGVGDAILPFEQDSTITANGMSVSVIRTPDTILT